MASCCSCAVYRTAGLFSSAVELTKQYSSAVQCGALALHCKQYIVHPGSIKRGRWGPQIVQRADSTSLSRASMFDGRPAKHSLTSRWATSGRFLGKLSKSFHRSDLSDGHPLPSPPIPALLFGAPSRKARVVNGQITKANNK